MCVLNTTTYANDARGVVGPVEGVRVPDGFFTLPFFVFLLLFLYVLQLFCVDVVGGRLLGVLYAGQLFSFHSIA